MISEVKALYILMLHRSVELRIPCNLRFYVEPSTFVENARERDHTFGRRRRRLRRKQILTMR